MDIFFLLKAIPNSNECITARRRGERVDVTKFGTREGRILRESMSPQCTVRLRHECFINQNFHKQQKPIERLAKFTSGLFSNGHWKCTEWNKAQKAVLIYSQKCEILVIAFMMPL